MPTYVCSLLKVLTQRSSPRSVGGVQCAVHCKKDYIGVTMCTVFTLVCYHCQGIEHEIIFHHLTKLHSFMGNTENVL